MIPGIAALTDRLPGATSPWIPLLLALVATGLLRRKLPEAARDGLFVALLSWLLLTSTHALLNPAGNPIALATALSALALTWFIITAWIERPRAAGGLRQRALLPSRSGLGAWAAACAGAAAAGLLLAWGDTRPIQSAGTALLLLLTAAGFFALQRQRLAGYASGAAALLLARYLLPAPIAQLHARQLAWISTGIGALALGGVLAVVIVDWRRRINGWRAEPDRLPPAPRERWLGLEYFAALAVVGGIVALGALDSPLAPLALGLAALAALGGGHIRVSDGWGEMGMLLTTATAAAIPRAWLPGSPASGLLATALAGAYVGWLAAFWEQQLLDGRPWTTAGRLIPVSRQISRAAAFAHLAAVTPLLVQHEAMAARWQTWLTLLLLFGHVRLLISDARQRDSGIAAFAAGLTITVTVLLLGCAVADSGWNPGGAALALAAVLVGFRESRTEVPTARVTYFVLRTAALPVSAVLWLLVTSPGPLAWGATVVLLAIALLVPGLLRPRAAAAAAR